VKFQIGAMSIGDILDRGIKLLTSRLLTFYVINLIVLAPILVTQMIMPQFGGMPNDRAVAGAGPAQLAQAFTGLLLIFLGLLLQPMGTAACLHVISQEFVDRHIGIGTAFRFALKHFWSLLWASILVGLVVTVGYMMCCVPGFLFYVWYIFVPQVVVVENCSGASALTRSKDLTSGFRWRIFGVYALFAAFGAIFVCVSLALGFLFPVMSQVNTDAGPTLVRNETNYLIELLVRYVLNILVSSYAAVCWTLFYFDLRIRKEGLDLELAAQQQSVEMGEQGKPGAPPMGLE
jgi:hypothetical protein